MQIPEGYTKLATIGMADKGSYNESETYYYLNTVLYNGSTYVALKDNPEGVPSNDGTNWKLVAQGFARNISLEEVTFKEALERSNIQNGDTLGDALGKLAKYCADLKDVAFSGIAEDSTQWSGYKLKFVTESEFQELPTKDSKTIYFRSKG